MIYTKAKIYKLLQINFVKFWWLYRFCRPSSCKKNLNIRI